MEIFAYSICITVLLICRKINCDVVQFGISSLLLFHMSPLSQLPSSKCFHHTSTAIDYVQKSVHDDDDDDDNAILLHNSLPASDCAD